MRRTAAGEVREILVHAADVAVGRFGRESEFRRRELSRRRLEKRAFENKRLRTLRDAALFSSHDACHGVGAPRIANDQHGRIQLALDAVQRLHRFALTRIAHDNRAIRELRIVERVHRLAQLEHDVVRHVHAQPERPHAAEFQSLRHEFGRGTVLDRRHHARRVARTPHGVLHHDLDFVVHVARLFGEIHRRHLERTSQKRRVLARNAEDGKRVRAVPCHLDIEHGLRLFARHCVAHKGARGRFGRELDDARGSRADLQFLFRTTHAERLDAAQFALLDLESALGDD